MMSRQPFEIIYAPIVKDHLRTIASRYHSLVRETIEKQLRFEPEVETRNRKPLIRPVVFEAEWEMRFGPKNRFRAFYAVRPERGEVIVLAIGEKIGDRLFMGGKEIEI